MDKNKKINLYIPTAMTKNEIEVPKVKIDFTTLDWLVRTFYQDKYNYNYAYFHGYYGCKQTIFDLSEKNMIKVCYFGPTKQVTMVGTYFHGYDPENNCITNLSEQWIDFLENFKNGNKDLALALKHVDQANSVIQLTKSIENREQRIKNEFVKIEEEKNDLLVAKLLLNAETDGQTKLNTYSFVSNQKINTNNNEMGK